MLTIDGSQGEGGGQVLRTSLSLSALTGQPFQLVKIRAGRSTPGLRPQHLTAVRAVAGLCKAVVEGDELGSTRLLFEPQASTTGGSYYIDVTEASPSGRSAGSVTLIFEAILWPLLFADTSAQITLRGGTFVPFSPPYHYLAEVALPAFTRFGVSAQLKLITWGWMAEGQGLVEAAIEPVISLKGVRFDPLHEQEVKGIAAVTNLPSHIPHRMARRAHNLVAEAGLKPKIDPLRERGAGPGAGIVLWQSQAGFSNLGRKGLPADKVAEAAVQELFTFLDKEAAVDYHLADQLLVPMALANGRSTFTTDRLTLHTFTNIALLRQWLDVVIKIEGALDQAGSITIDGVGFRA